MNRELQWEERLRGRKHRHRQLPVIWIISDPQHNLTGLTNLGEIYAERLVAGLALRQREAGEV